MTILHIVVDDKFSNGVFNAFKSDDRFINKCIIVTMRGERLNYLKACNELVCIKSRKTLKTFLEKEIFDYVFFHSLPPYQWYIVKYIPKGKKIIWWSWGYDLYELPFGLKPFISINLYKPLTLKISKPSFIQNAKSILKRTLLPFYTYQRKIILDRIDFFQPVLSIEYECLKQMNPSFSAKEYYYPNSFGILPLDSVSVCMDNGDILLGNSAVSTNNHLDVWSGISDYVDKNQIVHIPLNYGESEYASIIQSNITGSNIDVLTTFLPAESYWKLLKKCSYCVIGCIRQQAMGNILFCIRNGMKVFLYSDSLIYKELKRMGCVVFTIEEIDYNSFRKALPYEDVIRNIDCLKKECSRRKKVLDDFFETESINN